MRILIAEDDPISRRLLETKLSKWGHEVVIARDGNEAWQVLERANAPRLAILDWMMPGMDGLEVCRVVRKRTEGQYTYLLLLTAKGQKEDIVTGMDAGADDYLTKPFDAHELQARLRAGQRVLDLQARLFAALDVLREQATHDSMTRLWNHTAILDILRSELARAQRESISLSVIMVDLDHFKQVNDTYGHLTGDIVLREVAQTMSSALRPYDMIGRYGGEEFLIVLPHCGRTDAAKIAERLRELVAARALAVEEDTISVTISLGLAAGGSLVTDANLLIKASDVALYRAKRGGRNRYEIGEPVAFTTESTTTNEELVVDESGPVKTRS